MGEIPHEERRRAPRIILREPVGGTIREVRLRCRVVRSGIHRVQGRGAGEVPLGGFTRGLL